MTERMRNGLLNREFQAWDARLDSLLTDLEALRVFLARPGQQWSWIRLRSWKARCSPGSPGTTLKGIAPGSSIRLIVPALVLEELDDLKRHRDGRQKTKARQVLAALWDLHRPKPAEPASLPDQPDVTIEVLLDDDWHQRRPNNDGEIIDQAIMVGELTAEPTMLVSGDYTQLYRAASAKLQAVLMPRPDEDNQAGN